MSSRAVLLSLITSGLLAGCADNPQPSVAGIPEIGVARVTVDDNAQRTIVRGLDAAGIEVARLDLIHGDFAVTDLFREDFGDLKTVNGRKVDVTLHGKPHLTFEVAGFDPILHMPSHPAAEHELAVFLDAPTVKAVLDRWQLGWDADAADDGEVEYLRGSITGSSPIDCSTPATNCGSTSHGTMNTCGNSAAAYSATRISTSDVSYGAEYKIAQCCPSGSGGQTSDWFAIKACSTNVSPTICDYPGGGLNDGVMTSCGCQSATAGCKSCSGYPASWTDGCTTSSTSTKLSYCYVSQGGSCSGALDCCGVMQCDKGPNGLDPGGCSFCYWVNGQYVCS